MWQGGGEWAGFLPIFALPHLWKQHLSLMSLEELITTIMQIIAIFPLPAQSDPKLQHLFLLRKLRLSWNQWQNPRVDALEDCTTLNYFHLYSTTSSWKEDRPQKETMFSVSVQTLDFPSLAHRHLVIRPLLCAKRHLKKWGLVAFIFAVMQIKLPPGKWE